MKKFSVIRPKNIHILQIIYVVYGEWNTVYGEQKSGTSTFQTKIKIQIRLHVLPVAGKGPQ